MSFEIIYVITTIRTSSHAYNQRDVGNHLDNIGYTIDTIYKEMPNYVQIMKYLHNVIAIHCTRLYDSHKSHQSRIKAIEVVIHSTAAIYLIRN